MSKLTVQALASIVVVIIAVFYEIRMSKRRKKQREKFIEKDCLAEFNCDIILGIDKVQAKLLLAQNVGTPTNVILYDKNIVLATGEENRLPEIMIENIEKIYMAKLVWKDVLFIEHHVSAEKKAKYSNTYPKFYLSGDKEELLYIKDFIEERMNGLRIKVNNPQGGPS
jgi:hypothetical protein